MKRTCDGCRALDLSQIGGMVCDLGHDIDRKKGIPKEECPKPKTIKEYLRLLSDK